MAGAIKGITVEIGGDTTKLTKALNDVNKQSKSLQSELKGVESLLKMDPGNTELLAQKQQILAESVSNTKEKLETLKEVQTQVKAQFDSGEIGADAYRDFQREIEATEQKLKKLTDAQKEFGSVTAQKVAAAGEKVKEVGGKAESAGKAMLPVTAAITGIGAASVAAFNEIDEGYDTIIKATGAAGETLEGLQNVADNVFSSMNTDMASVGGAVGEVNTRFGAVGAECENLTRQFLEFSEITGQDVVGAIGNVDKIQEAWNIDASKTNEVLGLLAGKAQETGISVEALEQSALENNAIFKEMGLTFEQSIGLMAEFEKNGVNSSTAIAGLKKAVQNATKEGKTADEALSGVISSIKNASSETEALSIASELFGNKGAPEMVNAIKEGRLNLDELSVSMSDYANTVNDTYTATLDAPDKLAAAMNGLKVAGAELGAVIFEMVTPAIENLAEWAKNFAENLKNMPDGMKQAIVVIGGIVAAIGPLLVIGGKLISGVGTIMTYAPKIQAAAQSIIAAIGGISAPVIAVAAAVAALVAAFVTLMKNNEEFRNKITEIWGGIRETIGGLFQGIVDRINELGFNFQSVGEVISGAWNGLCNMLAPLFEAAFAEIGTILQAASDVILGVLDVLIGVFTLDWEQAWNGIKEIFGGVWEAISGTLENAWGLITGYFGEQIEAFTTAWTDFWTGVGDFFANIWNSIKDTAVEAWGNIVSFFSEGIPSFISSVIEWLKELPYNLGVLLGEAIGHVIKWVADMSAKAKECGTEFLNNVVTFFKELPGNIKNFFATAVAAAGQWITDMAGKAKEMAVKFISNVVTFIKELPGKVKDTFTNVVSAASAWVSDMGKKGTEAVKNLIDSVINGAKEIPSKMMEIGKNIVSGVWNGIIAAKDWFVRQVKSFFSGIVDGVKDTLGIRSPSTVFADEVGYWIPPGVGKGITKNKEAALKPLRELFDSPGNIIPTSDISQTVTANMSGYDSMMEVLGAIYARLESIGDNKIYLDGRTLVGSVIRRIDTGLADVTAQKARGM
ncbi:MAG: phage tail tape measure protein [bacterium]|nr:phage tail tape measure protein [bacterium]